MCIAAVQYILQLRLWTYWGFSLDYREVACPEHTLVQTFFRGQPPGLEVLEIRAGMTEATLPPKASCSLW